LKAHYSKEEAEEKDLSEGFFAHPSLGAHSFARWLSSNKFKGFLDALRQSLAQNNVKVFVVGSAFGGTGAAGYPAVAAMLRDAVKDLDIGDNKLIISGAFYLPYFSFLTKDKKGNSIDGNGSIDQDRFLKAAKNAMNYYKDNKAIDNFDKIYVLGAPSGGGVKIARNYNADRGAEQDNWPHKLELFGALAVKNFFDSSNELCVKPAGAETQWLGITVNKANFDDIEWPDLPYSVGLNGRINKLLLMSCIYVHSVLNPFITKTSEGYFDNSEFKLDYEKGKNFAPINKVPFNNGKFFGKAWSDEFKKEEMFKRFIKLNDYFVNHAEWFCQLFSEFEYDLSDAGVEPRYGKALFKKLIKRDILQRRVENPWNEEIFAANIGAEIVDGQNYEHDAINDDINNSTANLVKSRDIEVAIGELIRAVFSKLPTL